MGPKKTITDQDKGKVIIKKGKWGSKGHSFEIYLKEGTYFATIKHVSLPMKETFEINQKKFTILEKAIDARIEELNW